MSPTLLLFDVDGTLCHSTLEIDDSLCQKLLDLTASGKYILGLVGGGSFEKISQQMRFSHAWDRVGGWQKAFPYVFTENGQVSYRDGRLSYQGDLRAHWGDHKLAEIVGFLAWLVSNWSGGPKTGRFIDLRNGLIYFTPIGQNCTQEDRQRFVIMDNEHGIRKGFAELIREEFSDVEVKLGGEIGIGLTPPGWDKTFAKKLLDDWSVTEDVATPIHFYGDRIHPDGNDYPLAHAPGIKGILVKSPDETLDKLDSLSVRGGCVSVVCDPCDAANGVDVAEASDPSSRRGWNAANDLDPKLYYQPSGRAPTRIENTTLNLCQYLPQGFDGDGDND